ncbi:DUF1648 domain-containing protein [Virgibacillus sp. SK37]|uniref:DUF1648 domain-containing protein n=1 Tax=Virgibacillus sp. SK37 TaxID=403957 RepID=UPI0004D10F10|nr:DUF1648 domain-containing protein [Virgibacillus sp. SK37]AIF45360.1 hypothetical protein X953_07885 [Virgibacillus sp. SK37]
MNNHPKVDFTLSKWNSVLNLLSFFCIIFSFIYVFTIYKDLPDQIPIHFNAAGDPDNWGSKATILLMPLIALILYVPLYFLSKYPHLFNYPFKVTERNAPRIYPVAQVFMTVINFEMVVIFTYLSLTMAENKLGEGFILLVIVAPIVTIAVFLGVLYRKSRQHDKPDD